MNAIGHKMDTSDKVWERYRHNFSRHLLGVARHLQNSMMETLQQECGHTNLRLGFAPYITLIGEGDKRLTDLAEILGITRQACNQAVKQVEAAGYVQRTADPADGRAKQLTLSAKGKQLRSDGLRVVGALDRQYADIVGDKAISDAAVSLGRLYNTLDLGLRPLAPEQTRDTTMGGLLPRLSDYTVQRLMELTRDRGHPHLKLSFGQVLTLIGRDGGRIQKIADVQDVSKQAISVIVGELEELGYLERHTDPNDARQLLLKFSARGEQLITDSVKSVDELETEFAAITGNKALARLSTTLGDLYTGLQLEQEIFEHSTTNIGLLARQLLQQLGKRDSQTLAKLLMNPSEQEVSNNEH